ncbi:acylphosphatase [Listeria floridensis FSL S10-1187]|uniref:acylphosphatase n=1 Tax=Listeria floridensis FSL S10-1187 TaxID=1265817 RepID=A0ABN0RF78_9LIST|nr:acylphosphatase [Listeria floridensis]EUJ31812.1 acylphosphatase [Listeria floridensis FSL S10-1187]
MAIETAIIRVTGLVQGVGFRYTTKHLAYQYDVSGTVKNLEDGSVEISARAESGQLENFIEAVKKGPSRAAHVNEVFVYKGAPVPESKTFDIIY